MQWSKQQREDRTNRFLAFRAKSYAYEKIIGSKKESIQLENLAGNAINQFERRLKGSSTNLKIFR